MTDYTDHRAEAKLMLGEAHAWAAVGREPTPESTELAYLGYAAVHALFAIHDTLTAADRYPTNEERQRKAAQEAVGSSPDNPFTLPASVIAPEGTRFTPAYDSKCSRCGETYPSTAEDAMEHHRACTGETPENPLELLLCPECGDHINDHDVEGCGYILCDCPRTPEDVAHALIDLAVKATREADTDG